MQRVGIGGFGSGGLALDIGLAWALDMGWLVAYFEGHRGKSN